MQEHQSVIDDTELYTSMTVYSGQPTSTTYSSSRWPLHRSEPARNQLCRNPSIDADADLLHAQ